MPPPFQTYSAHINMASLAANASLESMKKAACEAKEKQGKDISASFDGTWQKHGFTSKNGISTAMTSMGKNDTSKVLDTHIIDKDKQLGIYSKRTSNKFSARVCIMLLYRLHTVHTKHQQLINHIQ